MKEVEFATIASDSKKPKRNRVEIIGSTMEKKAKKSVAKKADNKGMPVEIIDLTIEEEGKKPAAKKCDQEKKPSNIEIIDLTVEEDEKKPVVKKGDQMELIDLTVGKKKKTQPKQFKHLRQCWGLHKMLNKSGPKKITNLNMLYVH
jgi:hypothetical protein